MNIQNVEIMFLQNANDITDFINSLYSNQDDKIILSKLFSILPGSISVLLEKYYVDKVYRDSYYKYFSSKHFHTDRNCKRISFFEGEIEFDDFYSDKGHKQLQHSFIGYAVIKPISPGSLGRTFLDPQKIKICKSYIRTTKFKTTILGARLELDSFPFSSQDTEIMTCAETTVWSILEYYGSRYPDYKVAYPSDIVDALSNGAAERVLPSRGLSFTQISSLLKKFGFSPRIYYKDQGAFSSDEFKRIFHYYVESGIPIGVGINAVQNGQIIGHAVVCIGHSEQRNSNIMAKNIKGLHIINSADFYEHYVIMDDNQVPFAVQNYSQISSFLNPEVKGIVVPLYKRIILEASDASTIFNHILLDQQYGVTKSLNHLNDSIDQNQVKDINKYSPNNPLVTRLFLTSSRQFKRFRSINYVDDVLDKEMAFVYSQLPLPKFIWVAEISLQDLYYENKVFGEIIIDATASTYSGLNSVISIHYPGYFSWRQPHEPINKLFDTLDQYRKPVTYPLYENNLVRGGI